MAKLSIYLKDARTIHELTEERITIGRGPDNTIEIVDPSVSGRHAELILVEDRYRLKDLGSTNGTRVNGGSITEIFLREGDRILFGKVEARFESDAAGLAKPLPQTDEIEGRPAKRSEKPADFTNASPFPIRVKTKDPVATAVIVAAAMAILAFLVGLLGLLQIHGPR